MDKYTVLFYETRKQTVQVEAETEQEAIDKIEISHEMGNLPLGKVCGMDYDVISVDPIQMEKSQEPTQPGENTRSGSEQLQNKEYEILQLNRDNILWAYCNLSFLQKKGVTLDASKYDFIYRGAMEPGMNLESIFAKFNLDHPKDFRGHSLSVSDVVVLCDGPNKTAYFVDSFDFKELPEFFDVPIQDKATQGSRPQEGEKKTRQHRERE